MHITTPDTITNIAWEGELAPPAVLRPGPGEPPPVVTIGQPEIWPIEELFSGKDIPAWLPPRDDADYRLLRLACTLHPPRGPGRIVEARQMLSLRPITPPVDPQRRREESDQGVQSQNKRVYALLVAYATSHLYPQVTYRMPDL